MSHLVGVSQEETNMPTNDVLESTDIESYIEHKRQSLHLAQRSPWFLECVCWISSFILYLTVTVILYLYNDKKLANLPHEFQLNAIIGLLSSIANSLLLASVASVIGQSKWLHLRRSRSLHDLHLIDRASRGPSGSVALLRSGRSGWFGLLAAMVVCLALFISTFVQLSLKTYIAFPYSTNSASIPCAQFYNSSVLQEVGINEYDQPLYVDPDSINAVYSAFSTSPDEAFTVTASCSTGNCTWPSYHTLAFVAACADVTELLQSQASSANATEVINSQGSSVPDEVTTVQYSLPSGSILGAWDSVDEVLPVLNVTSFVEPLYPQWILPKSFGPYGNSSMVYFIVIGPNPSDVSNMSQNNGSTIAITDPVAYECALRLVVHHMEATQINSTLEESIVGTSFFETPIPTLGPFDEQDYWDSSNFLHTYSLGSSQEFFVNGAETSSLSWWLSDFIQGTYNVSQYTPSQGPNTSPNALMVPSEAVNSIYEAMSNSSSGLPDLMNRLAASLTQRLRTASYQPPGAVGLAYYPETRYRVAYGWLGLPFALLVISFISLVGVIVQSAKVHQPVWKNNILATVFHGTQGNAERRRLLTLNDMRDAANGLDVLLETDEDGGRHLMLTE